MNRSPRLCAVVPAAGSGRRFGGELPKQYLMLQGRTVLEHTLALLLSIERIERVVLVVAADDQRWRALPVCRDARVNVVAGGEERCHSVLNGLVHLQADAPDWVLVHDVARPCCPRADIERLIDRLLEDPVGGLLAAPVSDTLKRGDENQTVVDTVDRSMLWAALTPQMFRFDLLRQSLAAALSGGRLVTDEAQAVELAGLSPKLVDGSRRNIKITRREDLALADYFLGHNEPANPDDAVE